MQTACDGNFAFAGLSTCARLLVVAASAHPAIREILQRTGGSLVIYGHWSDPLAAIGASSVLNLDELVVVLVQ